MNPIGLISRQALSLSIAGLLGIGPSFAIAQQSDFDPNRFEKTVVVNGLTQPMEMAIAPD